MQTLALDGDSVTNGKTIPQIDRISNECPLSKGKIQQIKVKYNIVVRVIYQDVSRNVKKVPFKNVHKTNVKTVMPLLPT